MKPAMTRSTCVGRYGALLVSLFGVLSARPAAAAEQYLVEYRAYQAALDAGDTALAIAHGHLAWLAAEEELGDHRLTSILAYNYARLVVDDDAVAAVPAFRRAVELQDAGIGELDPLELDVHAAFAEFYSGRFRLSEARRLHDALDAREAASEEAFLEHANMWLSLAVRAIANQRYGLAEKAAVRSESLISGVVTEPSRTLAQAQLLAGVAKLAPMPRSVDSVQEAHNAFGRARRQFAPQPGIHDFDPLLAQVVAWNGAAGAALKALGREDYPDHEGLDTNDDDSSHDLFVDSGVECGDLEWQSRAPPRYPPVALRRGYIGAVVVGFNISEDLTVTDATILAEVPHETFSAAALESTVDWRLKNPPVDDPACWRNRLTKFTFVIAN